MKLSYLERLKAVGFIDEFKGKLTDMMQLRDDAKVLALTEEDWKKASKKETKPDKDGRFNISWDEKKEVMPDIKLSRFTIEYLKKKINEKDAAGEFTMADFGVNTLLDKLNSEK